MASNLQKVTVILGAGASQDCRGASPVRPTSSQWTPPLANELFSNAALHENIENILIRYEGATVVRELIVNGTNGTAEAIEEELRRIASPEGGHLSAYKHVPPYLRDYLARVSSFYTTSPGAYVHLANELLIEKPHDVAFIVLNYDTFLEQALSKPPWNAKFDSVDAYLQAGNPFQVFKVHGSVNWAVELEYPGDNWDRAVEDFDLSLDNKKMVMFGNHRIIGDVKVRHGGYYPVLTAPLAGKTDLELVCPKSALQDFLEDCRKFLIIGSSGLDADVLSLLQGHAPEPEIIHYVCGGKSKQVRDNFEQGVPQFKITVADDVNLAGSLRFRDYLKSTHFQNFATA